MRKAILPVALVVAVGVGFAVMNATAKDKPKRGQHGATIHVIEHATTDSVDVDEVGHVLTFANDVFDSADATKVGSDQGYCVRVVAHTSWECNFTTFLHGGQITVEGPFSDTGNTALAITGGTGKYRNARGWMELNYHNPQGTKFDFVFHLHGGPGH
jgi:allene oxide cyclase